MGCKNKYWQQFHPKMYRGFVDDHKLHTSKGELEEMKRLANRTFENRGWRTTEKGKDYHGNDLEMGHVRAWSKDKYHMLLHNAKESYVAACALAILEAKVRSGILQHFS